MAATETAATAGSQTLRDQLVDAVKAGGYATNPRVEEAMRVIPREPFLPDEPLDVVYADQSVTIKPAEPGARLPLSTASQPSIVAMMLDQLDPQPSDHILEIGAGSGANAAYLGHLVGDTGHVVTIDVHEDITDRARRALAAAHVDNVEVITGDGAHGDPNGRLFNRIQYTVGATELTPGVTRALADHGRIVVPFKFRGTTRSLTLHRRGDTWESSSVRLCGFIPMVGEKIDREATIDPGHHVTLFWDSDQTINPDDLRQVLDQPRVSVWSGETIGAAQSFDGIWLRLAATEPGTCRIAADPDAVRNGLATPAMPTLSPALVEGHSLAYFAHTPPPAGITTDDERRWHLGAYGHGPLGRELAERLCAQIRAWSPHRDATPTFTFHPAGTKLAPDQPVIERANHRITITY